MRQFVFILCIFSAPLFAQEFSITESKTMKDQVDYVRQIKFSPLGNYIVMSFGNNTTELYDKNWNKLYTTQGDKNSLASQCVFSPDERLLIFSKYKNKSDVGIYHLGENQIAQTLLDHDDMIYTIAISPNGRFLATGGGDPFLFLYQLEEGRYKLHKKLPLPDKTKAYSLAFSPDSKDLAIGLYNGATLMVENKNSAWTVSDTIKSTNWSVDEVIFSPDGKTLAISNTDSEIQLYRKAKSGYKIYQTLTDLGRTAESMAFSPDNQILVAGLSNGCICIWQKSSADTLVEVRKMYRNTDRILDVCFSPDGKSLSTSSYDRTGIIWSLEGVQPSDRSVVANILGADITLAQRQALTGNIPSQIIQQIDPKLTAPKDEFETNMEFLKRREKLRSLVVENLQNKMEDFYLLDKKGQTLETKLDKVVSYDADQQLYFVLFMETAGKVKMPVTEAKTLKENWRKAKVSIQKSKEKNGDNAYRKFTLLHPTSGKKYEIETTENPFVPGSALVEKARSNMEGAETKTLATADTAGQKKSYGGTKYALLFATNDYDNYTDLVNPVFDAKAVKDELQRNYGYQTELVENATLDVILKKLKRYAQLSYDKEDQLFIFFAGHGKYDEIFREGYLVAKESKLQDDARTTFLSHSNLRTIVNNIECEHTFLVMDVCFGGTFDPYISSHRGEESYEQATKTEFVQRKMRHKTRLYLTSGGKEYVPDGRPGEHSPFARKFLEALRSYGGKDGILTVNEIVSYVEKVVPQPRTGEFGNNEPGSDFVFLAK
jgi:WD40 repeat protein